MSQLQQLNKTPTPRQQKAAELLVENSRKDKPEPIGKVLQAAGYSKASAIKPSQLTRSQGFIAIMEKIGATDEKLAEVLNDGLNAKAYVKTERVEGVGKNRIKTEDIKEVDDTTTRHKYLETALRLKGLGKSGDVNVNFNNIAYNQRNDYQLS
jgi:hypothetical protein